MWPHDPNNGNLPICTATGEQLYPNIVPDGANGWIITWEDHRSGNWRIYVQRVSAGGTPLWTADGVALTATGDQYGPMIVSDGAGGAIITWYDSRNGGTNNDIFAQRVNSAGTPQWTANGVPLCNAANDQINPRIVTDGAGGAIVTWNDSRVGNWDVYAQRVNAAGTRLWTVDGVALGSDPNGQYSPTLAADGSGGAIVAWHDNRNGGANNDIYAQRVNAAGTPQWAANGVALCAAGNDQVNPVITPDGAGGAIVTWQDARNGSVFNNDIFAQRVSAAGTPQWAANGVAVCTASGDQPSPAITSDGAGGAVICWSDFRGANYDIYVQHVNAAGAPQWTADGVALCAAAANQNSPTIVSDGAGGAIVTWQDARNGNQDIYAQRVVASGTPLWTGNGVAVSSAVAGQTLPAIASDGAAGAVITWYDSRNAVNNHIYAQRIERFGMLGSPEPLIAGVHDVPGDQGGNVKVSWYPSYLDPISDPNLTSYDVFRSAPGSLAERAIRSGARRLSSFAERPTPGERAFVMYPASIQLYAWEYLTTVNAFHYLSAYGYETSTAGDSTASSNPLTAFMVVGHNSNSSMYWPSAPDSGYSVDNLPPVAPAPFAGTYSAGTAQLHWHANHESDLAGYRLYRGSSSSFTPTPGNRIATPADTLFNDPAGNTYYYKLSAVDIHDNESAFTTLLPTGAADVPGGARPRELGLDRPSPNPALTLTTLRYGLPEAATVTLAIYDASGRRVRALVSGLEPAGEHALLWDLRDDSGRTLGAGLYFVQLKVAGHTLTQRMTTLR